MFAAPTSILHIVSLLIASAMDQVDAQPSGSRSITDLRTLGGTESYAYAINDCGQIVGLSRTAGNAATHSFLYQYGQLTDLHPLNSAVIVTIGPTGINNSGVVASGVISQGVYVPAIMDALSEQITVLGSLGGITSYGFNGVATAINNDNQAVGYSYLDEFNRHAFLWQDGELRDLGSFGGYSFARDINDFGIVVGSASEAVNGVGVACFWDENGISALFPGVESSAYGINSHGQVVGQAVFGGANRSFLYQQGVATILPNLPTGRNGLARAINNAGQIVGDGDVISSIERVVDPDTGQVHFRTNYADHAFLYDGQSILDLNDLVPTNSGWVLSYANDINEKGEIVGYGTYNGEFHAFLLVIPEPSTIAFLVLGSLALVIRKIE